MVTAAMKRLQLQKILTGSIVSHLPSVNNACTSMHYSCSGRCRGQALVIRSFDPIMLFEFMRGSTCYLPSYTHVLSHTPGARSRRGQNKVVVESSDASSDASRGGHMLGMAVPAIK